MANLLRYVGLLSILWVGSANAQITYDGCVDIRGVPVASIANYQIQDVANANIAPNGQPYIQYNPQVLSWLNEETRLFFFAHECAHHVRGHILGTTHPLAMEQDADCWAIYTLVQKRLLSRRDLSPIQEDLNNFSRGDWTHLPGYQRAINLEACLDRSSSGSSRPRSRPTRQSGNVYCCDQMGNRWCQISNSGGPTGAQCWCAGVPGSGFSCR